MPQIAFTTISHETSQAKSLVARWATAEDHEQSGQRRHPIAQQNFLLTRAALRALLNHTTGKSGWKLRPDSREKLQAFTATEAAGPHISLSHTQGLIACAVSPEAPIGIDVERWRARDFIAIATYAFGPSEREAVARDGEAAFYRIWTLREAMAKATGDGLIAMIDGRDWVLDEPQPKTKWQLFYDLPEADCSVAIAIQNESRGQNSPVWIDVTAAS